MNQWTQLYFSQPWLTAPVALSLHLWYHDQDRAAGHGIHAIYASSSVLCRAQHWRRGIYGHYWQAAFQKVLIFVMGEDRIYILKQSSWHLRPTRFARLSTYWLLMIRRLFGARPSAAIYWPAPVHMRWLNPGTNIWRGSPLPYSILAFFFSLYY